MQIMTGCERLQAEKCFRILYFPFSHLTCLHTHNCLRHNKTCFLGWLPRLDITGIPLYGRFGNSTLEFAVVAPPSLFTGVDKSTAGLNSQTVLMRIYAHFQNLFHCCSLFFPRPRQDVISRPRSQCSAHVPALWADLRAGRFHTRWVLHFEDTLTRVPLAITVAAFFLLCVAGVHRFSGADVLQFHPRVKLCKYKLVRCQRTRPLRHAL